METTYSFQVFGSYCNKQGMRKAIKGDLLKEYNIIALNGPKNTFTLTTSQPIEPIIDKLQKTHNGFFPGIGNYGFYLK